jgi:hypothetical protein
MGSLAEHSGKEREVQLWLEIIVNVISKLTLTSRRVYQQNDELCLTNRNKSYISNIGTEA